MKTLNDFNTKTKKKPWEVEGVEWREVKLGDRVIAEIIMGQSPPSSSYNKVGEGVPFLQGNKEFGEIHPQHTMFTTDPKKIAQNDDILLSVRAPVGDVNIADQEYCIGRGLAAIRFSGESKYLFYLFISIKEELEELGKRGTTFKAITKNHLKNLKIPIPFRNGKPDLETQKKIVEFIEANFSRINKILEKKKKELKWLDELWESVLEQAFKPKEGEEWREVRLGDIAEHFMGGTPKTSVEEYWNGHIPWISAKELSNNDAYITKPTRYITEKGLKESNARIAPKNSILLVTTASVGNIAIAGRDIAINQQITAIIPRSNIWYKYLYYYLLHNAVRLLLRGQTTFKHINQKIVKKLPVLLPFRNNQPDLGKQKEIANYLDSVYEKIKALKEKIQNQITQLEKMKESILDEVFNNENKESSY